MPLDYIEIVKACLHFVRVQARNLMEKLPICRKILAFFSPEVAGTTKEEDDVSRCLHWRESRLSPLEGE